MGLAIVGADIAAASERRASDCQASWARFAFAYFLRQYLMKNDASISVGKQLLPGVQMGTTVGGWSEATSAGVDAILGQGGMERYRDPGANLVVTATMISDLQARGPGWLNIVTSYSPATMGDRLEEGARWGLNIVSLGKGSLAEGVGKLWGIFGAGESTLDLASDSDSGGNVLRTEATQLVALWDANSLDSEGVPTMVGFELVSTQIAVRQNEDELRLANAWDTSARAMWPPFLTTDVRSLSFVRIEPPSWQRPLGGRPLEYFGLGDVDGQKGAK